MTATDHDALARRFDAHRAHLRAVAHRMLGSRSEADDAVQEAWFRLTRAVAGDMENLGGWLTTVVARISLDHLRALEARREAPINDWAEEFLGAARADAQVARDVELADSVGDALLVVLGTLAPAERLAFVLHDLFDVPFAEIAAIAGRSSAATLTGPEVRARLRGSVLISQNRQSTTPPPRARPRRAASPTSSGSDSSGPSSSP